MTFNADDDDLYESYLHDPYANNTRVFYATLEDTAVMLARLSQPHRLGGWYISHLSGEVVSLEGKKRAEVLARAGELARAFGSSNPYE